MINLSAATIEGMCYTDFIAFIKETNRCPGGKKSIRKIIQNSFINEKSKILEIGSNTGFTSLEVAHLVKAKIFGIDISPSCVKESKQRLEADTKDVKSRVKFRVGSAYNIPFKDEEFDLVITGGATSFMEDKETAISEYIRVTKPWGFIATVQLYYRKHPPKKLLNKLSKVIGVDIKPYTESDWLSVFQNSNKNLELYFYEPNELCEKPGSEVDDYIEYFLAKKHIAMLPVEEREAVRTKWRNYLTIFNENHRYLGYSVAIFRKTLYPEEPELFTYKKCKK